MYIVPSASQVVSLATDRVTGHARHCAREWACPKLEGIWTCKYVSLIQVVFNWGFVGLGVYSGVGRW